MRTVERLRQRRGLLRGARPAPVVPLGRRLAQRDARNIQPKVFGNGLVNEFREAQTGFGFSPDAGDYDNLTNFSTGRLEDQME